jgi:hypothetical protein
MVIGRAVLVRMEDAAELETLEGQWWCYCKGIFWVLTLMTVFISKSCALTTSSLHFWGETRRHLEAHRYGRRGHTRRSRRPTRLNSAGSI